MPNKLDNVLTKQWAFGFQNRTVNGVQNLTDKDRNAIFYISSHSGVIYDFENRTQTILQGHRNIIQCCAVSKNKNFIVTCDSGEDPIIVIWDSRTGMPMKSIMNAHPNGIDSVDISDDCLFIVTLGRNIQGAQEVAIWAWSREHYYDPNQGPISPGDTPILISEIPDSADQQHTVCFDSKNKLSIVSTGQDSVIFWNWEEFNFEYYVSRVPKSEFANLSGKFTSSLFLSGTNTAITATSDGFVIVWEPFHQRISGGDGRADVISMKKYMKAASKVLKLVECGITTMTTTENNYLALGCSDGAIRFYDFFLRLESWFEDIQGGCVTSLSFSVEDNPHNEKEAGSPGLKFWVPNFIIGTADALVVGIDSNIFDELNPEDRRGVLLLQGFPGDISDVKCHPTRALVAFTCSDPGSLQIWNYDMKLLMNLREFQVFREKEVTGKSMTKGMKSMKLKGGTSDSRRGSQPQCIAFEEQYGEIVAIGFRNGDVKILSTETLQDIFNFCPSSDAVSSLKFSPSGSYLAGYDEGNHTVLFKRVQEDNRPVVYIYIGRIRVHSSRLAGIDFGYKEGVEMLMSVGEDRRVCEYDIENSSIESGLLCQQINSEPEDNGLNGLSKSEKFDRDRGEGGGKRGSMTQRNTLKNQNSAEKVKIQNIEVVARPTAILWYPRVSETDIEDRFIIVNDEYKFKEFNSDSKQCRKTTLTPIFSDHLNSNFQNNFYSFSRADKSAFAASTSISSPPNLLIPIRIEDKIGFYAYSCTSRIIGLGSFPLTGNPAEVMGINAHPGLISGISVSYDGKYFFSTGGADLSAYMYDITLNTDENSDNSNSYNLNSSRDPGPPNSVPINPYLDPNDPKYPSKKDPKKSFLSLLEGGEGGELHEDIIEYFYFCQLRAQGEESMNVRTVSGEIPIEEIPSLMRAVGFYPSEAQVVDMLNEVRYQNFMSTGLTEEVINLSSFISLYVNHRPVLPLNNKEIARAFATIAETIGDDAPLTWSAIHQLLLTQGENISPDDLQSYLSALLGAGMEGIPEGSGFDATDFTESILGFES